MNIFERQIDINNLHHAYLVEGDSEKIISELFVFLEKAGIKTYGNPNFNYIITDSLKIKDARNIKSQSLEKPISINYHEIKNKKVFIISINNFLIEAQNALLKMFEDPIENTLFFLIIPDSSIILPTLLSRFYVIKVNNTINNIDREAEKFLIMTTENRINFIKEAILKSKDKVSEDDNEELIPEIESNRSRAIKFLNEIEFVLHKKLFKENFNKNINVDFFYKILKAREYLSVSGSSTKSIMEGIALIIPKL